MSHTPNPWHERIYLAVLFLVSTLLTLLIVGVPMCLTLSVLVPL